MILRLLVALLLSSGECSPGSRTFDSHADRITEGGCPQIRVASPLAHQPDPGAHIHTGSALDDLLGLEGGPCNSTADAAVSTPPALPRGISVPLLDVSPKSTKPRRKAQRVPEYHRFPRSYAGALSAGSHQFKEKPEFDKCGKAIICNVAMYCDREKAVYESLSTGHPDLKAKLDNGLCKLTVTTFTV